MGQAEFQRHLSLNKMLKCSKPKNTGTQQYMFILPKIFHLKNVAKSYHNKYVSKSLIEDQSAT